LLAGRVHLHRLTPARVNKLLPGTGLLVRESKFVPALGLQYMTILDKHS